MSTDNLRRVRKWEIRQRVRGYAIGGEQRETNLNNLGIPYDDGTREGTRVPIRDGKKHEPINAPVRVIFENIEQECVDLIGKYDFVVGCVAWFTSEPIIRALARLPFSCQIVVQKEDFLRPDAGYLNDSVWAQRIRKLYEQIPLAGIPQWDLGDLAGNLSTNGERDIEPVRCVGNHNSEKSPAAPRMHHKFLVFCEVKKAKRHEDDDDYSFRDVKPKAVWTGSFNLTKNGGRSLENVVVIDSPEVARLYFTEWEKIYGLSEPLDWEHSWAAPSQRIGS